MNNVREQAIMFVATCVATGVITEDKAIEMIQTLDRVGLSSDFVPISKRAMPIYTRISERTDVDISYLKELMGLED